MCMYIHIYIYRERERYVYMVASVPLGKGQMGSALMGSTVNCMLFDGGTFGVLPLTYCYIPKYVMAYLFPKSTKIH